MKKTSIGLICIFTFFISGCYDFTKKNDYKCIIICEGGISNLSFRRIRNYVDIDLEDAGHYWEYEWEQDIDEVDWIIIYAKSGEFMDEDITIKLYRNSHLIDADSGAIASINGNY